MPDERTGDAYRGSGFRTRSRIAATICASIAIAVLIGWAFDLRLLQSGAPSLTTMKANSAAAFLFGSFALWLHSSKIVEKWKSSIALACALAVVGIGVLSLGEYVTGRDFGIDQVLVIDRSSTTYPGRMSPATAVEFVLAGLALAFLPGRTAFARGASKWLSLAVGLIGVTVMIGYTYGFEALFGMGPYSTMAVNSAVAFVVLGAGGFSLCTATRREAWPIAAKLVTTVGVALASMLMIGAAQRDSTFRLMEANRRVAHTNEVITALVSAGSQANRAEDAIRGYLIIGDRQFLETYRKYSRAATEDFANLRRLTADNPVQQKRLDGLEPLLQRRLAKFDDVLEAFRTYGLEKVGAEIVKGGGPALQDNLLRGLGEMEADERFLLQQRTVLVASIASRTVLTMTIGTSFTLLFLGIAAAVIYGDFRHRREIETALRESETQFRTLANTIPQLCWMATADGAIFWYNHRWYEYTGATPEEMEGWGWQTVHDPEQLPAVMERWKASIESGQPFDMTFPLRAANGEFRAFLTRIVPVRGGDGSIVRWFGTNTDVQDHRDVEAALRRNEEKVRQLNAALELRVRERTDQLETANRELGAHNLALREQGAVIDAKNVELEAAIEAKDRFLASMSHELRTPLNAILGFTGTMLMGLPGPITPDQNKQLQIIRRSARHLLSLISDLLDLARIGSGKVTLNFEPLVLQDVVQEVCTTLRALSEERGLALRMTVPGETLTVATDRRALTQILLNLTGNAVKFTDCGEVHISLGCEPDGIGVRLSVRDTGIGIPLEDQPKLFGVFGQLEGGSRREGGTGLGLHLSQKLAGLLGGRIVFESEYGRGSTFTLCIPSTNRAPAAREPLMEQANFAAMKGNA